MIIAKPLLITKLKATGVHLSLSLLVFAYLAYQIYFNWYPAALFFGRRWLAGDSVDRGGRPGIRPAHYFPDIQSQQEP